MNAFIRVVYTGCLVLACGVSSLGQAQTAGQLSFDQLKAIGASHSSYRTSKPDHQPKDQAALKPALEVFHAQIKPVLLKACVECHGPDAQEGNTRIDTLEPDLLRGSDVARWLEVFAVVSNGEMPPANANKDPGSRLSDQERSDIVQWLSGEIQRASTARRAEQPHSSFRRLTRYETNYALQDLFGVPYDFTKDLPPETTSEDGFQNSSDLLHMSTNQLNTYRELALSALQKVTVPKEKPAEIYWGISMASAWNEMWSQHQQELNGVRTKHKEAPEALERELTKRQAALKETPRQAYYKQLSTGDMLRAKWEYYNAKYARAPVSTRPDVPTTLDHVAIIPPEQRLVVELGDTVPDAGTLRVRVRAARMNTEAPRLPSLQLEFGWQASNDSQASVRISQRDIVIDANPDDPKFYQWDIPLSEIYPRNTMRKVWPLGGLPNPSEFLRLVNSSVSTGDIQIDYVEIIAPVYEQWPPASHTRIFRDSSNKEDESVYAQEILENFLRRAWRRQPTASEVEQKLALFKLIRIDYDQFEPAMIQVLATALASPKFLYIAQEASPLEKNTNHDAKHSSAKQLTEDELATRLSMFLWCSIPDEELARLAASGQLRASLQNQVQRMLEDPRSRRFSEQFVRQWLGMQLLNYLKVDEAVYPTFDEALQDAMQEEPIAFFETVLRDNGSMLDFLHADYTVVNERLAQHYDIEDVYGNQFRRVALPTNSHRGGLLTQAGLLAMNSDGKDSHPLKRGIWMLKNLLNDPPPPPPPAVPKIDLADPKIAQMTLKQRIENHRNQPACYSCHAKIDPWGIAFENFDATGDWRDQIKGQPVDASSELVSGQKLDGIVSLKRFLLEQRQDQFVRAMIHKMLTFALGRPLTFADYASAEKITAELRNREDRLATMIQLIVQSDLFQSK